MSMEREMLNRVKRVQRNGLHNDDGSSSNEIKMNFVQFVHKMLRCKESLKLSKRSLNALPIAMSASRLS